MPSSGQAISFSAGFANKVTTVYVDVYADWNQNGSFGDAGETLVAAAGSTSCGTYCTGETEDYTPTVTGTAATRLGSPADRYTIYPNPATDVLTIERPASADASQPLRVHVYDLRGVEVAELPLTNDQLRVSTLSQGVYLLTVGDGTTTSHQRFVKQ